MSSSFTFAQSLAPAPAPCTVLVTGAAGKIGSAYVRQAPAHHRLRLMIRPGENAGELAARGEITPGELADRGRLVDLCRGIDTVLHLAGDPRPDAAWEALLETNILGTYNLVSAAQEAGARRVVYASSIHAVSGYPPDVQVKTGDPVNPGDLYGVSKCFGEALGRYYAEQRGLSFIALRIAAFQPLPAAAVAATAPLLDTFVSDRDLVDLIVRAIDDRSLQFGIFHGVSDNRYKRLDISDARALLGYHPVDDLAAHNPAFKDTPLNARPMTHRGPKQ